ncbi:MULTISPECIES: hypothetical protein [unclassified Microcystis]|uniref:Uncharacterized protein n=1 Tax=Microcystis aeruginosa Ma_SC_T_19800800_S464 TaxID=2486257 RepID=A0A552DLT4_MICAE|nr:MULTISPECIES: hypothetical protein [unclassified Microcystis]TRT86714.1 MAG: hypothetical protein EWV82_05245 [Microcystis aeruginosa Ma_AC_P_19900807_S299]TRU23152.1 MAG: hypothetical protein EWV81_16780 [Microcystis aeruginosa Ma_SC_T_19800800_S464]
MSDNFCLWNREMLIGQDFQHYFDGYSISIDPDRGTSWLNSLQHKLFGVFERKSSMQITPHC